PRPRLGGGCAGQQVAEVRDGRVELLEQALVRLAVWPPAAEAAGVPETVLVELVVRHLADELHTNRRPVLRHLRRPASRGAAEPSGRAAGEQEAALPRMPGERDDERAEHVEELLLHAPAERRRDADVADVAV